MRRIALKILHDEAQADDVVQGAMLKALERPPPRNLRAWLAAVTRNLAISAWRSERSRGRRERAAAREERLPSVGHAVARLETQRQVVDAVLGLEEPYRSVIVLRFFYELSPREIADRLDVPLETVRTRLRRAQTSLRAHLQRHHEDRKAMLLALVPLLELPGRGPAVAAAGLAVGGGLVMKVKLAGAAALLLCGALVVWTATRNDRTTERSRTDMPVATTAPEPVQEPEPPPVPTGDTVVCAGRVVDALGAAVAGAEVLALHVLEAPRDTATFWHKVEKPEPAHPAAVTKTGPGGAFRLRLPKAQPLVLRAKAPGRVSETTFRIVPQRDTAGIVLRLLPAGHVRGVVVDADNRPVAGARLRLVDLTREPV
ncbi:MAG: sigma-70 family RNA polymerase sigma factor, partial [Planctomycetota bacterium]